MPAPSYLLTNYTGTTDPAADVVALVETRLTAAGWTFIEEVAFTQAANARLMRVWKNPSTLNAAGTDFYIGLVKNAVAGTYLAVRAFEGWDATAKTMLRPAIAGSANSQPLAGNWKVTFGGGLFVAVTGPSNVALTSTDGLTWTERTLPATATWTSVAYGGGMYVAIASGGTVAASSPDGITWTARTLPSSTNWVSVAYGGGMFVALTQTSGTAAASSPDGITWTARTMPNSQQWNAVTYGGSMFVAVPATSGTFAASSPDGITWTTRTLPTFQGYAAVTYGGGMFVTVPSTSGTAAASSPDGITWTARTLPTSTQWSAVTYGGGVFVAVANPTGGVNSTVAATSPDGITWTARSLPVAAQWTSIAYGASTFVAVTSVVVNTATPAFNAAATSSDGITWTQQTLPLPALFSGGTGAWLSTGATSPAMVDLVSATALIANTNYDIGILASKSYLSIGICNNGTTTWVLSWVVGLHSPIYADSQALYPPLMVLDVRDATGLTGGVSRSVRVSGATGPFTIYAGPESILIGAFTTTGGAKEVASQSIRTARVALAGSGQGTAFGSSSNVYRGWLYDAIAVGASSSVIKVGDTVTIGATVYTALALSATASANFVPAMTVGYFFNTAAGT